MAKKPDIDPLKARLQAIAARPASAAPVDIMPVSTRPKRAPRQPIFRQATIVLRYGERVACVVKNVSASGAKVEYFAVVMLSERITLMEPTLGLKKRARVVWQEPGSAGLEFID